MKLTKQAEDQTILQHGLAVFQITEKLISGDVGSLPIQTWYEKYYKFLIKNLHPFKTRKHYCIWHDISKPFMEQIDRDGNRHFYNHALASSMFFKKYIRADSVISNLIKHDMDFHIKKFQDIINEGLTKKDLCTLLITSLGEILSNAKLFGGYESESFIIKFKKLQKLGNKICSYLFDHPYVYVLVREDLSNAQKRVQSSHAILELSRKHLTKEQEHPSIIILGVPDQQSLIRESVRLQSLNISHELFREPDIGNEPTALATVPLIGKDREIFTNFQLIR